AWQHVAATFNAATQEILIYVNGTLVPSSLLVSEGAGSIVSSIEDSATPVRLGTIMPSSGVLERSWDGSIDEPALYRRVLSAVEIQAIHSAGSAGKPKAVRNGAEGVRVDAGASNNTIGGNSSTWANI